MAKTMRAAAGKSTKRETVQEALELLARVQESQSKIVQLHCKIEWESDLDPMRRADAPVHWPEHDKE
jgi:Arc/MetJ family transcription regulator